ncbi:hypothetical protein METP1_01778 [Methanosarcinales archaeon]|nr:hypothetical protein METP1_01778 [Methanosarcinales archaeon]
MTNKTTKKTCRETELVHTSITHRATFINGSIGRFSKPSTRSIKCCGASLLFFL